MKDIWEISSDIEEVKREMTKEGLTEADAWKEIELSLLQQKNDVLHELSEKIEGIESVIEKVCNRGFMISGDIGLDDVANAISEIQKDR